MNIKNLTVSLGSTLRKDCKNRIGIERFEHQIEDIKDTFNIIREAYVSGAAYKAIRNSVKDLDIVFKITRLSGIPCYTTQDKHDCYVYFYFKTARYVDSVED